MSSTETRNSFGATAPPFIDYLKDILRGYPDGGQILKELIQNADDAGATRVVFIHDERNYGHESILTDEFGKYQGPALFAFNDARFTSEDWQGIQATGRSVKRKDPNKVGRFGIGFNSVYHITDVPWILSSDHLAVLDPHEKLFGQGHGGYQWSLADNKDQESLKTFEDQFRPFQNIVEHLVQKQWTEVLEDQQFDGTLFRFPLRKEISKISDNLYNSDKVAELFVSFIADAELCLLFLKNVQSVSLIHVMTDSSVSVMLEVTSSCSEGAVLESRDGSIIKSSTNFKDITVTSEDREETKNWLLTTCCLKEGNVQKVDSLAEKLCFLPQVDLAFPCGQNNDSGNSRLSCFLPLPNNESHKTGLPLYVNASFGLTNNRREIKWQEEDQKQDECAMWNELLVKEVLPQAYLVILKDAIELSKNSELPLSSVYDIWPDFTQLEHKEKWHSVAKNVLQCLFRENIAVLSLAADERIFVCPLEAVLPCDSSTCPKVSAAIQNILISCGDNLVKIPERVERAIEMAYPHPESLKRVTPTFLRTILHKTDLQNVTKEEKVSLLEYVLSDGTYEELQGLPLLPLSDGTFRSFTNKAEDVAFIDSQDFPRSLLPGCKHLFIPQDLSTTCQTHLKTLATRDIFNVINIDADKVTELAKRYLPTDWKQGMEHVTWEIGSCRHPPAGWLQEFWKFLNTHFRELIDFTGMPLISIESQLEPTQPMLLARIQQNTTLIFQRSKQDSLPQQIAELVRKVGGTVVRGAEWLKHEDIGSYVLPPSPRSVLQVIVNTDSDHLIKVIQAVSRDDREGLKNYLCCLDSLSAREQDVLSELPLFQTMKGSCVDSQSKQAVILDSWLTIPTELLMPDNVIQCVTEADRRLLQQLNIDILDTPQAASLLIDCVQCDAFGKDATEKTMTWILEHGGNLFSQNKALKAKCKELNFIQLNEGWKKASQLFDPRIETFKDLFPLNFFPPAMYTQTAQMLQSLTELGLLNKEADLTTLHLLDAVKQIENLQLNFYKKAVKRAEVILSLLNTNDVLSKFSKPQLRSLLMMKWVPCVKPGQQNKERLCFFCPHEIGHSKYEDIVGHVMPLKKELSEVVRNKLGIEHLPPPLKVLENMSVISSIAHTLIDPDTDVDFNRKLHSTYTYMQGHIHEFAEIVTKDTKWLWAHNKFVSPVDLVLQYPQNLDLSSYIGKIPKEFLPYQKLLIHFGLRKCLSMEEIVGILNQIKGSIEERQIPVGSPGELKMAIEILNWMGREKRVVEEDIPVPVITDDEHFTLKPLSTTVFCDISRDGLEALNNHQEEFYVIHAEIPRATAEWLKIPLLSTRILSPEMLGIQQCGQSEPITMRIKNILNEYDEEHDIFKELIQNAEDARAKACRFMVDFRVHKEPPESLFDPGMTACQGPCLWSYNDEQFTEADWTNIIRVGSASKENMVDKIGKFGLGFNTVYHVTDCPSILSGSHLLMLDPNVTHLKKHIKEKTNPGIKLDLTHHDLFKWFPGQFKSYENIFDCHFSRLSTDKPYKGTLIKLPFRTQEEAFKSEISTKVYDRVNIVGLQNNFMSNSQIYLLFLKNVNTVSLQNITENASTPPQDDHIQTQSYVSKSIVSSIKIPDQIEGVERLVSENKKCYELIDCNTAQIVQIEQQESGSVHFWLLYNCFGTQECLKMIHDKNKEAKFTLPVSGIAVPLDKNPNSEKWRPSKTELIGQAFCFLPLSIQTGLPVNLNGPFAVTSNRKALWARGVKNEWNKALLQDPAKSAYITVLSVLKNMSEEKDLEGYCYFIYWPDREKVTKPFQPLVDAFYSAVVHQNAPEIFSDGEHWCCFNKAIFLHESIEENEEIGGLAMRVAQSHVKQPNHVVPLPIWLRNSFKKAGLQKDIESRTWNWERFYEEAVFRNLATMDAESRNALVLHAIDLDLTEIDDLLMLHPCIPTKGGQLQCIKKVVNPTGKVACLFQQTEGRLLEGTENDFSAPRRVQRLLELGMLSDHIPLEEIAHKVGSINYVWNKDQNKACVQLKCVMEQLCVNLHDKDSLYWESIRNTAFLPAFSPESERVTLQKPIDVFNEKYRHLVNMTEHVLDHTNLETYEVYTVLNVLKVRQSPPLETVLQQLESTSLKKQSSNETRLHEIANKCYTFLNQWLEQYGDTPLISERAHSFPFILVGCKFVHAQYVAEQEDFEAKPYLHVLPSVFACFKSLWETVGVQKKFTKSQYLTVIEELHASHGQKPLSKSNLNICLTVLRGLHEKKEKIKDCLIPNEHGVLQPAAELSFNDSPWMPLNLGVTLCHEDITRVMARHFGIKTTKHQTLENSVVANMSPFDFEFEQREELTVRIKNIIAAYPSKKDILKELIQNADDAEATEIQLVWDKRHHGTEKTFGKKWNNLQGPALCVYNNKVFSDADLKGIQQLGEGGKHNTPGKTGKYGIGFNSVYNITDCPSILTGDKILCISDPNQTYIESPSGKTSGCGYNLDSAFKETYLDVYESFLPKEFSLEEGTMFRLPLRIGTMANNSKISAQGITDQDIEGLFSALLDDPEGLILFSKNIQKIQLHKIEDSGKLENVFKVEKYEKEERKERKDKSFREKTQFQMKLKNALKSDGSVTPYQAIYRIQISTSSKSKSEWVIADQFGSFKGDTGRRFDKLPQASVAACVDCKPYIKENFKGGTFCTLPLPVQTGLPVHVNGNFEVDSSRRDLWKEDGKSLKVDWNLLLKIDVIAPLYADLLYNICRNIPKSIIRSTPGDSNFLHDYLRFFPSVSEGIAPDWQEMIHEVYRSICNKAFDVIPVSKGTVRNPSYVSFREYSFEWCNVKEAEQTDSPHLSLEEETPSINPMLERLGMKLVPFSTDMANIWESFKAAGVKVRSVSPSTVNDFLREKPLNDPTKTTKGLPLPIKQTLIQDRKTCAKLLSFCLKDKGLNVEKNKPCSISGLPLLLTNDHVLRVFDPSDPKLFTRYHSLFCGYEKDFVDYRTIEMHIEVLQPKYVKKLTIPHAEKYLKAILPSLLKDCEVDPLFGFHVPNAAIEEWLISAWKFFASQLSQREHGKQSMTLSIVRELFDGCQMLPVVCQRSNNKHFLQTMMSMPSVIQFKSNEGIQSILFNLGCMRLDISLFLSPESQVLTVPHSEFLNTSDKSAVLDFVLKLNPSEFCNLSNYELNELQRFLQCGLLKSMDRSQYQRKVKSLPIFETPDGKRVRIDGPGQVFIVNGMSNFRDLFNLKESSSTFLKQSSENEQLSEVFQIPILSDLQYFVMFVLPVMHALTEEQILRSIKMLLSLQIDSEYPKHEANIISSMKGVKLIRSVEGNLEMASFYFDDHVGLYTIMLPQGKFVPPRFWKAICNTSMTIQARELVKKLGMKHSVSNDEIIAFAYQIESESKGNCELEDLQLKATELLSTAMKKAGNNKAQEIDKELIKSLADIKFILPVQIRKDLCTFQSPAVVGRTLALRGSLIGHHHQHLIWTSMPIIALKPNDIKEIIKISGAFEEPPMLSVTTNMVNICQLPCQSDDLNKIRAVVFRHSYAYLQNTSFPVDGLTGWPVVLVENDTQLVNAEETSLGLPNHLDFRPYLYKIQPKDAMYAEFFKRIGVTQEPTVEQYCHALTAVFHDSVEKETPNSNQKKTIRRAVEQIFLLLKRQEKGSPLIFSEMLYLPSKDGKLYPSDKLYFNDTVFQASRLEKALANKLPLLESLSICHLGDDMYEHRQLVQMLPENLQPKMLSQCTEERLGKSNMHICQDGNSCEFRIWFEKHLSSRAFRHGLICLLREQSKGEITKEEAGDMCDQTFGSIQIICCRSLETELCLDQQPLNDTVAEADVYVKKGQQECTFYLKHNDDRAPKLMIEINLTMSKEINALLGNKLASNHLPVLGLLLMCDSLPEVQQKLAKHGIHDSAEADNSALYPAEPGSVIPDEWLDCLDMNMLNNFEEGEYVGYLSNELNIYAVIVKKMPGATGQLSRRYKIQTNINELIEVSSLELYQFIREKKPKLKKMSIKSGASCMELELHEGSEWNGKEEFSEETSSPGRTLPASLDEAKREIDNCLEEIWTLSKEEKHTAIKRLYLRWHPDKNQECIDISTEAFKYLKNRIDELTNGKTSESSKPKWSGNFRDFFENWNQEARRHRKGRERFHKQYPSYSYNFWTHQENVPTPDRAEAQRWLRQARCDLAAAENDIASGSTEWCLFKVHQIMEKALIAAEYKRNGKRSANCTISIMAARVACFDPRLRELTQIVNSVKLLGVDAKKTQYPDYASLNIPHEQFKECDERPAVDMASELLCMIEAYVH